MTQGERIKEVRKKLDLTLEEFGKKLGVGKTAISKIEKGQVNLTEHMFKSICREFNVSEEWLRTGEGGIDNMFFIATPYEKAYNRFGYIMENSSPSKKAALTMLLEILYAVPDDKWDIIVEQYEEIKKEG